MSQQDLAVATSASAFAVMAAASMNSAFAADIPARKPAAAPAPVLASGWGGFYVGGSVGGTWLNSAMDDSRADPSGSGYASGGSNSSASKFGALGALQAGFNMQSRSLVYGVEADFSFLNGKTRASGRQVLDYGYGNNYSDIDTLKESRLSHLGTMRARVGVDVNGTMPYLTAGVAFGRVSSRYATSGYWADTDSKSSKWRTGFAVGAGVEHKLSEKVSIRGEALFVGFGDKSRDVPSYGYGNGGGTVKTSNSVTIGRVGMNYRF